MPPGMGAAQGAPPPERPLHGDAGPNAAALPSAAWANRRFGCYESGSGHTSISESGEGHSDERSSRTGELSASAQTGAKEIAVHARDHFQLDLFRAHGFAFADVGATAEEFPFGLRHHGDGALGALRLSLRQQSEDGNLCAGEKRRRRPGAHGDTGAAADAG